MPMLAALAVLTSTTTMTTAAAGAAAAAAGGHMVCSSPQAARINLPYLSGPAFPSNLGSKHLQTEVASR